MKLKLKTRILKWQDIEKEVEHGTRIEYYGNNAHEPDKGKIIIINGEYYIEWEDQSELTRINGSEHSNRVLENCGFIL